MKDSLFIGNAQSSNEDTSVEDDVAIVRVPNPYYQCNSKDFYVRGGVYISGSTVVGGIVGTPGFPGLGTALGAVIGSLVGSILLAADVIITCLLWSIVNYKTDYNYRNEFLNKLDVFL